MITEENEVGNWKDLCALVEAQFKKGWIYRGVRSDEYKLRPSIGRDGARRNSDGREQPYSEEDEKELLKRFKREARNTFEWRPANDLEWMILGQHHRLPTRLLDWTESLFVAAFFAAENPVKGKKPAIYGVRLEDIDDDLDDPFDPKLGDAPRLIRPPHITTRITAQRGVLTIHPRPSVPWEADGIHRWCIAENFGLTLKGLLAFSGIHAASLFPDSVDRHTEYLGWLYKRGRLS